MAVVKRRWCPQCEKFIQPERLDVGDALSVTMAPLICPECGGATDAKPTYTLGCVVWAALAMGLGWWFWPSGDRLPNAAVPAIDPAPAPAIAPEPVPAPAVAPLENVAPEIPAPAPNADTPAVPAEVVSTPATDAAQLEREAAQKLDLARKVHAKSAIAAEKRLQEIIDRYPGTKAAAEAAEMLRK